MKNNELVNAEQIKDFVKFIKELDKSEQLAILDIVKATKVLMSD